MFIVAQRATVFVDGWVMENIFCFFTATLLILLISSSIILNNSISRFLLFSTYIIALIVLTPVLKYPNPFNIYGIWDSLAHFSFAKWIVMFGHIPQSGEVMYSENYGFHPGNGLIPAFIHIITKIDLGITLELTLIMSYILYTIAFILLVKYHVKHSKSAFSLILLLFTYSFILISPYYTGLFIAYGFSGLLMLYIINAFLFGVNLGYKKFLMIILYLGLLLTHFSTASIFVIFLIVYLVLARLIKLKSPKNLRIFSLITIITFLMYTLLEIYADINLLSISLRQAIHNLLYRFIHRGTESPIYEIKLVQRHTYLTFIDQVRSLIGMEYKRIILLFIAFASLMYYLLKLKNKPTFLNHVGKLLFFLNLISLITLGMGVIVFAYFKAIVRGFPIAQMVIIYFFLCLLEGGLIKRLKNIKSSRMIAFLSLILLITMTIINFTANFKLQPLLPRLQYNGEEYILVTNGAVTPWPSYALFFTNTYTSMGSDIKFLCPYMYITFSYCDILSNINREHIFLGGFPDEVIKRLQVLVKLRSDCIIPFPLKDYVLAGKHGLTSLYTKPSTLLYKSANSIYTNGFYVLFYTLYQKL